MKNKITISIILAVLLFPLKAAQAHCPLCVIGAGMAAGVAAYFGVSYLSIGLVIGAFAVAMGLWFGNWLNRKKKFFRGQTAMITLFSYITTVWPLRMMFKEYTSLYIANWGKYGRVLTINKFLLGTVIGGLVMVVSPYINQTITKQFKRRLFPFQGMAVTFGLLLLLAVCFELLK